MLVEKHSSLAVHDEAGGPTGLCQAPHSEITMAS